MTGTKRSLTVAVVVVLSAVVGTVGFAGSAAALDSGAAATYPRTPGSDTLGTFVYVARPNDTVADNGIDTVTLRTESGSFQNVSDDDIFMVIRGGERIEIANQQSSIIDVSGINTSTSANGKELTIQLPRPVQPQFASDSPGTGAEVAFKVDNFTTPSQPGSYAVNATFTDPSGASDGPTATDSYPLSQPAISLSNQSVSQFDDAQSLNVSAAIPGGGYVGLFTTGPDGSPDQLVGSTDVTDNATSERYSIDIGNNVSESQEIVAVAYTESEGRSQSLRDEQTFNPTQDDRLVVNGNLVNATAQVSTLDVDAQVAAGDEYDQGARLLFSQGEPSTSYQVSTVDNGSLGSSVTNFETAANGTAVIDTADLEQGQYAISRVDDGSIVGLDNDSTTGPGDDSFVITGQQLATTSDASTAATAGGSTAATSGESTQAGASTSGSAGGEATQAGGDGNASSGNESGGGSGAGGPGFGVVVAVVALLGAALIATRRR